MKVWLVARGEYDTREVVGVFADEAVAEASIIAGFGSEVEEFDVLDDVPTPTRVWTVTATLRDGVMPAREVVIWAPGPTLEPLDVLRTNGERRSRFWCRSTDRQKATDLVRQAYNDRCDELELAR